MRNLLVAGILLGVVLCWSAALADDEWDVFHSVKPAAKKAAKPVQEPDGNGRQMQFLEGDAEADLSSQTVGGYFGLGDEFAGSDSRGLSALMHNHARTSDSQNGAGHQEEPAWRDKPADFSEADGGAGSTADSSGTAENVYGPMWGVPGGAVGLDGFSGNPYPGMIDGEQQVAEGHTHESHTAGDGGHGGSSTEADPPKSTKGKHKINRRDPNEW